MLVHLMCALLTLGIDILGCFIPLIGTNLNTGTKQTLKQRSEEGGGITNFANAFGVGAMMALTFVHLLPEAYQHLSDQKLEFTNFSGGLSNIEYFWPLCLLSFFLIKSIDIFSGGGCCGGDHHAELSCPKVQTKGVESPYKTFDNKRRMSECSTASPLTQSKWIVCVVLFIHSFFEGMVIGSQKKTLTAVLITVIMCGHKWIEGMVISSLFLQGCRKNWAIAIGLFSIATPLGILGGAMISNFNISEHFDGIVAVIAGMSLLNITLCEVQSQEFGVFHKYNKRKFFAAIGGAALVTGLTYGGIYFEGGCNHAHGCIHEHH